MNCRCCSGVKFCHCGPTDSCAINGILNAARTAGFSSRKRPSKPSTFACFMTSSSFAWKVSTTRLASGVSAAACVQAKARATAAPNRRRRESNTLGQGRNRHRPAADRVQDGCDDVLGVETGLLILQLRLVVLAEDVRQDHRTQLEAAIDEPGMGEKMRDVAGKAADA